MNIAVTQSEYFQKDRNQMLDCLDQRLVCFLQNFGVSIYPIPNSLTLDNHLHKWVKNAEVDAIVLSGGGNVGDASGRDHIERILIKLAIQRSIPLIGICRGMQAIILYFGGSLVAKSGHVRSRHQFVFDDQNISVNSYHDFCVDHCPAEFSVLARSEDRTIESVRHKKHQILGIMWHPEREKQFQAHDLNLFSNFIKEPRS